MAKHERESFSETLMLPSFLKTDLEEYAFVSPTVRSTVAQVAYSIEVTLIHDRWSGESERKMTFPIVVYEANR